VQSPRRNLLAAVRPHQQTVKHGLVAFAGIVESRSQSEYDPAMTDRPNRTAELARHSYDLACIVQTKYRRLLCAVYLLVTAAAFASVVVLFKIFHPA
jgi:hypothetical protein